MRQSAYGFCEMQAFMVMSLINMNRYDDAYNIIKFRLFTLAVEDSVSIANRINGLEPGEWLHNPKQNRDELTLRHKLFFYMVDQRNLPVAFIDTNKQSCTQLGRGLKSWTGFRIGGAGLLRNLW